MYALAAWYGGQNDAATGANIKRSEMNNTPTDIKRVFFPIFEYPGTYDLQMFEDFYDKRH